MEDLEQYLVDNGFEINVSLWKNTTKQDIIRLKWGACNIVVSHAGVELAEYMKKKYDFQKIFWSICFGFIIKTNAEDGNSMGYKIVIDAGHGGIDGGV